jgi:hypothetical protein
MKFRAGLLALAAAALPTLLAAQANPPAAPAASPAGIVIERVTVDELKKLMEADKALVLDVRSTEAYRESHIAGSVSAPLAEIDKHVAKVKAAAGKTIVTYCT